MASNIFDGTREERRHATPLKSSDVLRLAKTPFECKKEERFFLANWSPISQPTRDYRRKSFFPKRLHSDFDVSFPGFSSHDIFSFSPFSSRTSFTHPCSSGRVVSQSFAHLDYQIISWKQLLFQGETLKRGFI